MLAVTIDQHLERMNGFGSHRRILLVLTERLEQQRLALLVGHHGVHHSVLQCLIGTNRHTKLLAGFGVLERLGIQHAHNTDGLCRECNDRLVGKLIDH